MSPFNKPSDWWVILTQKSVVENEWLIQSLVYFHFFEALNDAFEVQFLHLVKDTDSM